MTFAAATSQPALFPGAEPYSYDESREAIEGHGDWVDPQGYLFDDPTFPQFRPGFGHSTVTLIGDREEGKLRPIFENEQQLSRFRADALRLANVSPRVECAFENLLNYTIGRGLSYSAEAKPKKAPPPGLLDEVETLVEDFLDVNDWIGEREREVMKRSRRDGEQFLGLFPAGDGVPRARFIEPQQITEPPSPIKDELERKIAERRGEFGPHSWTFGIHTRKTDVEDVFGYFVQWDQNGNDWDYLPAEQVWHTKENVDRNVKRGLSDLILAQGDIERETKFRRNIAEGAALQAAIAWIVQHPKGTSESQALGGIKGAASQKGKEREWDGGTRNKYAKRYGPGSILETKQGSTYVSGPMGSQRNPNLLLVGNFILRALGCRWNIPEYMISGDASNANLASTLVAGAPFVKARENDQGQWERRLIKMLWKVLSIAVDAGRFRQWGITRISELRRVIKIKVDFPAVDTRDPIKVRKALAMEVNELKTTSRETAAQELDRDFEQESELRSKGADTAAAAMPPGSGSSGPREGEGVMPKAESYGRHWRGRGGGLAALEEALEAAPPEEADAIVDDYLRWSFGVSNHNPVAADREDDEAEDLEAAV